MGQSPRDVFTQASRYRKEDMTRVRIISVEVELLEVIEHEEDVSVTDALNDYHNKEEV